MSSTSDVAETYQCMNQMKKDRKAARLENANLEGWTKCTDHHYQRKTDKLTINYWPSTGLVMIGKKRHNINSKFIQQMIKQSDPVNTEQ